jgi:hypothetical protein
MGLFACHLTLAFAWPAVFFQLRSAGGAALVGFLVFAAAAATDGLMWALPSLGSASAGYTFVAAGLTLVPVVFTLYLFVVNVALALADDGRGATDVDAFPADRLGAGASSKQQPRSEGGLFVRM